ncbi:hypothetical protein KA025_02505 [Candidatus Saccharibacteria bacterium]|nr:hypothetical protein [Candidatus Saccharibacteria bacterium]
MGFLLLIIAKLISYIIFPIGWIYSLITFRTSFIKLSDYALTIALGIDQLGNVVMSNLFNDILIYREGHKFGNPDETVSFVLGKNKETKTLKYFGRVLSSILNKIDKNHVEKAAKTLH